MVGRHASLQVHAPAADAKRLLDYMVQALGEGAGVGAGGRCMCDAAAYRLRAEAGGGGERGAGAPWALEARLLMGQKHEYCVVVSLERGSDAALPWFSRAVDALRARLGAVWKVA